MEAAEIARRYGPLLCAHKTDAAQSVARSRVWRRLMSVAGGKTFWSPRCVRVDGYERSLVSGRQISLKKFLRAGLPAGRFVQRSQTDGGNEGTADKALALRRDDEPVIGLAADIGASGSGAFYRGDQMRITKFAQEPPPTGMLRSAT